MLADLIAKSLLDWVLVPWMLSIMIFVTALNTLRMSSYLPHTFAYFFIISMDSLISAFKYDLYGMMHAVICALYTVITLHFIMSYYHYSNELIYLLIGLLLILCTCGYIVNSSFYVYAFNFLFSIFLCIIVVKEMMHSYAETSENVKLLSFSLLFSIILIFFVLFFHIYHIKIVWSPYAICGIYLFFNHLIKEYRPIKIWSEACVSGTKKKSEVNLIKNMNEVRRKLEIIRKKDVCSLIIGRYGNPILKKYEKTSNFSILYVGISKYVTCIHPLKISTVGAVIFDFCKINDYPLIFILDADYLVSNTSIFDFVDLVKKINKYAKCSLNIFSEYLTEDEWKMLKRACN